MIAFLLCYLVEDFLAKNIKSHQEQNTQKKRNQHFRYGLDYIATFLLNPCRNTQFNIFQILSCT